MLGFTLEEAFAKVNMPLIMQTLLKLCYHAEHRIYHNIDHISEMLTFVPKDHSEVEIILDALLFHDIVYSPYPVAKGVNEALSIAEYLSYNTKALAINNPFSTGSVEYERRVIAAICATAHHCEDQDFLDDTAKWVLDLDLYMYALPWDEYMAWREKRKKEDALVCKFDYTPSLLLKRKAIYYKMLSWEAVARKNIQKEIDLL